MAAIGVANPDVDGTRGPSRPASAAPSGAALRSAAGRLRSSSRGGLPAEVPALLTAGVAITAALLIAWNAWTRPGADLDLYLPEALPAPGMAIALDVLVRPKGGGELNRKQKVDLTLQLFRVPQDDQPPAEPPKKPVNPMLEVTVVQQEDLDLHSDITTRWQGVPDGQGKPTADVLRLECRPENGEGAPDNIRSLSWPWEGQGGEDAKGGKDATLRWLWAWLKGKDGEDAKGGKDATLRLTCEVPAGESEAPKGKSALARLVLRVPKWQGPDGWPMGLRVEGVLGTSLPLAAKLRKTEERRFRPALDYHLDRLAEEVARLKSGTSPAPKGDPFANEEEREKWLDMYGKVLRSAGRPAP